MQRGTIVKICIKYTVPKMPEVIPMRPESRFFSNSKHQKSQFLKKKDFPIFLLEKVSVAKNPKGVLFDQMKLLFKKVAQCRETFRFFQEVFSSVPHDLKKTKEVTIKTR